MSTLKYKGHVGTIEPDDGSFTGRVICMRDVVTFEGETFAEVEAAFHYSIDDYLAFCAEAPDRPYSGKNALGVESELHRVAATRAAAEGLSLSQWIARRMAD